MKMLKDSIANPDHPDHYRYQTIVDRWFALVMFLLIAAAFSHLQDIPYFPAFLLCVVTVLAFGLTVVVIVLGLAMLVDIGGHIKDFLTGY